MTEVKEVVQEQNKILSKKEMVEVETVTSAAPSTPSWASLFSNNSNASNSSNAYSTSANSLASNASSLSYAEKPVAKVAPYRFLAPVTPSDEFSLKFADFLTQYKSDWATTSLKPRGLRNRSNYCYINSILQALLGCSPLYNLIRSIPKQAAYLSEVKTPAIDAM